MTRGLFALDGLEYPARSMQMLTTPFLSPAPGASERECGPIISCHNCPAAVISQCRTCNTWARGTITYRHQTSLGTSPSFHQAVMVRQDALEAEIKQGWPDCSIIGNGFPPWVRIFFLKNLLTYVRGRTKKKTKMVRLRTNEGP